MVQNYLISSNIVIKAKKINKCFSGHFLEKQIVQTGRQAGRLLFLFFISQNR